MSERLDILMPLAAKLPRFVVDTTPGVLTVPVTYPATTPVDFLIYNGEQGYKFVQGDNFIIGTFGLIMPLGFQLDKRTNPHISFSIYGYGLTSTASYPFKEIGADDILSLMYGIMENYDTACDIFIDIQNQNTVVVGPNTYNIKNERFALTLSIGYTGMEVSMVGVPTSLDGTTQYITPYLKVYHNFSLDV